MTSPLIFAMLVTIAFASALGLAGCQPSGMSGPVLSTEKQPASDVSAVVTVIDGNATVSKGFHVYVQSSDAIDEVLRMDKGEQPRLTWLPDGSLQVDVACGQIYRFTNFATVKRNARFEKLPVQLKGGELCGRNL
jgi:hypothetical protein